MWSRLVTGALGVGLLTAACSSDGEATPADTSDAGAGAGGLAAGAGSGGGGTGGSAAGAAGSAGGTADAGGDATSPDAGPMGSVGCKTGSGLTEGEHKFMLDGRERRYEVYLPKGYTKAQPWPVLFALHGNGGSPDYWNETKGRPERPRRSRRRRDSDHPGSDRECVAGIQGRPKNVARPNGRRI